MVHENNVTELIFTGLFQDPEVQKVCFVLFLPVYLATVLGNGLIVVTISVSKSLNSPMYIFLSSLSIVEICYSSTVVPKFITDLLNKIKTISPKGCLAQIFFFHFFGVTEILLLTVMAYDRFVAICYPMRYTVIMNPRVCTCFTVGTWLGGFVHGSILTFLIFKLPYCGPNKVNSFFCDIPVVLSLACADTSLAQTVSFTNVGVVALTCFLLVLTSYTRIVISILKIRSSEGRRRAFSTCSAHLTSIILVYGPVILVYLRPASSPWLDSGVQVFNNVVTPSLNPLIYSLRNKEVKLALRKMLSQAMQPVGYKE